MRHHRWLKLRTALLEVVPQDGQALLRRLPCTALQAWLAHHAWHTAREHFHGLELAADGDYEEHQRWELAQQQTAQVYDAVAQEFWQVRQECTCLAHRIAGQYRLVYAALTGAPVNDEEPIPEE